MYFHVCNICDIVFPSFRSISLYLNWCTRPSDKFYGSKFVQQNSFMAQRYFSKIVLWLKNRYKELSYSSNKKVLKNVAQKKFLNFFHNLILGRTSNTTLRILSVKWVPPPLYGQNFRHKKVTDLGGTPPPLLRTSPQKKFLKKC